MKQITAKNYKKLPEVQQKLEDIRDRQIKKANRLLADVFNQVLICNYSQKCIIVYTNRFLILEIEATSFTR